MFNYVYVLLTANLDAKEREDFDSTLNSGVTGSAWARIEERAFDRLAAGEFDVTPGEGDQ